MCLWVPEVYLCKFFPRANLHTHPCVAQVSAAYLALGPTRLPCIYHWLFMGQIAIRRSIVLHQWGSGRRGKNIICCHAISVELWIPGIVGRNLATAFICCSGRVVFGDVRGLSRVISWRLWHSTMDLALISKVVHPPWRDSIPKGRAHFSIATTKIWILIKASSRNVNWDRTRQAYVNQTLTRGQ